MKAEIKGDKLVVTIQLYDKPAPSKSGKTLVVTSTGGFAATTATINDKPIKISLNAIISRD